MPPGTSQRLLYDFSVYDSRGQLAAVVEAKRRFDTSETWARAWHAGIVARAGGPIGANLMLFTADRVYVWRPGAEAAAPPDFIFDAERWLRPYLEQLRIPLSEVVPGVFEEVVGLWLRDVVLEELPEGANSKDAEVLLRALRGGEVVQQAAA
jgi:hypothetical protein